MSTFRSLLAAGALTLGGAMSPFVAPGHAALHPNAINLNAINLNAINLNAINLNSLAHNSLAANQPAGSNLAPTAQATDDAWHLSPRGVTLPSGRSFELPR